MSIFSDNTNPILADKRASRIAYTNKIQSLAEKYKNRALMGKDFLFLLAIIALIVLDNSDPHTYFIAIAITSISFIIDSIDRHSNTSINEFIKFLASLCFTLFLLGLGIMFQLVSVPETPIFKAASVLVSSSTLQLYTLHVFVLFYLFDALARFLIFLGVSYWKKRQLE